MEALDTYIERVRTLPPAPRILVELLPLLRQEDAPAARIVEAITFDPALTAKVLQRCNSAAWGLAEPVEDLDQAVMLVGFNEIFRLVAAVVGEQALGAAQPQYGIAAGELWQHSAAAAVGARLVAQAVGDDGNVAFTAGLLHDVGKLVIGVLLEGATQAVAKEIEVGGHSFVEAERLVLGVEHAEVGGRLLARWNFPPNLVRAVALHHDPLQARPYERLAACVYLGDLLAHFLGFGHGHQAYAVRGRSETLELLRLSAQDLERFVLETDAALNATRWFARAEA